MFQYPKVQKYSKEQNVSIPPNCILLESLKQNIQTRSFRFFNLCHGLDLKGFKLLFILIVNSKVQVSIIIFWIDLAVQDFPDCFFSDNSSPAHCIPLTWHSIEILNNSYWRCSAFFFVNFEYISHLGLMFLLLTLNR